MRLATLLLALFALPAAAQAPTYAVFASQADLDDGGTLNGAVPTCLLAGAAQGISGAFFWDATSQVFAIYDADAAPGERTTVPVAAFFIDLAAGTNVTTCRDAVPEIGADGVPTGVVFFVLSNSNNEDFVARVDAEEGIDGFSVLTDRANDQDSGDGISGIAQIGTTLYLARQQFNGAPEDGIYTIDTATEDQIPTPLVIDADLDLVSITSVLSTGSFGPLYAVSSEFGEGDYTNVVLRIDDTAAAPALDVFARPCEGVDPTFTNCTDGGLEAVTAGLYFDTDITYPQIIVLNNSFDGPDGETAVSFYDIGEVIAEFSDRTFSEAALIAATGVSGFTPSASAGVLSYIDVIATPLPTLYLAGSDQFDGAAGIYSVTLPFAVGAEEALEGAFALAVAPNPAVGAARLSVTPDASGALTIDVVDALGRTVAGLFRGDAAAGQALTFATPSLAPGVYTVRVQSAVGVATERFTVVR